ncbi:MULTISPECIES: lyase family protein [Limnobaculum]|uniref:lyase family protein n=1 Tax=Limnobaculum TaxID=2172100 RepID=UPI001E4A7F4B|nr:MULTISPECIES: lyase family protein [Limnobaculum]
MSSKLWGGRFDLPTNKLVEEFNATIMIEQRLCPFDIKGSIAHATMLGRQNIISQSDADTIISGLKKVEQEIENGQFVFSTADEDIHMAIEKRMTEIVGPVGGKLHTGRSRNDQTTLDSKMHMRATILEIQQNIRALQATIVAKAEQNFNVIMPGL